MSYNRSEFESDLNRLTQVTNRFYKLLASREIREPMWTNLLTAYNETLDINFDIRKKLIRKFGE